MKLIYRIVLHMLWALSLLLAGWAVLFYLTMIDEINDEVDDALDITSERIIKRVLAGRELPTDGLDGRNFLLEQVSEEFADANSHVAYTDEEIYIPEEEETEPARVLRTVFCNAEGEYRQLTVMTPTIEKSELQEAILWWVVWLYLFLLLTVLAVNMVVMYRTLRPLYALLGWLDAYTVGRKNKPLENNTKITEFRRLNDAVRRSAERTEGLFEQQKQFVGNASHEMQTPLAVCRNRLEMLVGDGTELTEEQLGEVMKVQRTLDYLVRLNRSLLLLSKIDSGQFPESEEVNLNVLVKNTAGDLSEIYASRNMHPELAEQDELMVRMNPSLAASVVGNLVKNAFLHGEPGGRIALKIVPGMLQVCNTGSAPLDSAHLFERFYQGTKKEGSTGLGLSIVAAVCRHYGFRITYNYSEGEHCFSVYFGK